MDNGMYDAYADLARYMENLQQLIENFLRENRGQITFIVLLGPTASGKTALSLKMAKVFGAEIISADSRQVYRYMDIGTDKIPPEKRGGIPHHLIDVVNPDARFTVADFKKMAEDKMEEIFARGKLPLMVGGTGLYLRALTENFQIPETGNNLSLRKELEEDAREKARKELGESGNAEQLEEKTAAMLHERLQSVDPSSAAKIHPRNLRYILRALEIFYLTGKPKDDAVKPPKYKILKIGLNVERSALDERIHRRVDEQFEKGLAQEVEELLGRGYDESLPAMQTLGYREMIPAVRGKISFDEAKELIKIHTRQFSRRQMIWFKREKNVHWASSSP